jgi:hypothetical protein
MAAQRSTTATGTVFRCRYKKIFFLSDAQAKKARVFVFTLTNGPAYFVNDEQGKKAIF